MKSTMVLMAREDSAVLNAQEGTPLERIESTSTKRNVKP